MLVTAHECAADLRRIASHIHQAARNYAVTEANVTADINRIEQAASQESRLLRETGGLPSPPDVPEHSPPPLPRTTPNPAPNQPPTPPRATPTRPEPTKSPPPSLTPRPSPEASPDPDAWKRGGATFFFGPFPTGKPSRIEQAAEAWRDLASALRTAWEDTQHYTAYVMAESEGDAANKFHDDVQRLVDYGNGSLTLTLEGCEQTERACWDQAQSIRDLKYQFEELAFEFALTFIIGQIASAVLAPPTAGGSEAAGQTAEAAAEAGITDRAMALLRQFIAATATRMKTVGAAVKDLARVLPGARRAAAEGERLAKAETFGERLGAEVQPMRTGKTAAICDRISQQGMSQEEAARAADAAAARAFESTGGQYTLGDGRVVILPAKEGSNAPILIVEENGSVSLGLANFKVDWSTGRISVTDARYR